MLNAATNTRVLVCSSSVIRLVRARAAAERLPTNTSTVQLTVNKAMTFEVANRTIKYICLRFVIRFNITLTVAVLDVFVIVWSQEHLLTLGASQHVVDARAAVMIQTRQRREFLGAQFARKAFLCRRRVGTASCAIGDVITVFCAMCDVISCSRSS